MSLICACSACRLRRSVGAIISNAIKYTPSGSASLTIRWRDPVAEFEVADSGVGIAETDLQRIFEIPCVVDSSGITW